jgi:uncharacterized protein (TIGR01777 family)
MRVEHGWRVVIVIIMRVAITGASGFLGSALARDLLADGHEVLRLVRREPRAADEARWDPYGGTGQAELSSALEGADALVHLAGAGVGDRRWTAAYKRKIRDSRVIGTRALAETLAGLGSPPGVLVSGSAVGFYGDGGDRVLDETAPIGGGFLAPLVRDWEDATEPAATAGVRVACARTGLVVSPNGGLLGKLLPLFRLGLGARLGDGRQWMSWISLPDHIAALRLLIESAEMSGPVNLTGPDPVRNADFTRMVARAVHRPAVLAVPAFALRLALPGFADESALVSQRALPVRLEAAGFPFRHRTLDHALAELLENT